MKVICGEVIEGELLEVDGKHFIQCTLIDCILQYGGGVVIMEGTKVSGCHHVFCGTARMTINYLEAMDLIPQNRLAPGRPEEIIH